MALARGVGRQEHLHLRVVAERLLHGEAFRPAHAAVDDDDRLLAAEQRRDALLQIAQRVPVLGEEDEFLPRGGPVRRNRAGAVRGLAEAMAESGRREDLAEQAGQLAPLGVPAPAAYAERQLLERLQGFDLRLQLRPGAGGGRPDRERAPRRLRPPVPVRRRDPRRPPDPAPASSRRRRQPTHRRAGAPPARAGDSPTAPAAGATTGRLPPATRRGGAGGWSARSRPCRPAWRWPARRRD